MTGNVAIDLAISAIGVAILVGLARLIFGGGETSLDKDKAVERLAFDEPDFAPIDWLIDKEGKAALARNRAGETAMITVHGDELVTRRFAAGCVGAAYREGVLTVDAPDHTMGRSRFATDDKTARLWLELFVQTESYGRNEDREDAL